MDRLGGTGPPRHVPATPSELDISHKNIENGPSHELGCGSSSVVRRVEFNRPGESIPIAVKVPDYEGTVAREQFDRFVTEAETWASLSRTGDDTNGLGRADHVVEVFSWGTEPLPWIAMEFMDGGDLRGLLEDGDDRLPLDQALWIGIAVCEAVLHAHRHGVAHLDLKPSNVLFRRTSDGWPLPKVTDWGLAKMLLQENETRKGLTPAYAAPEQFHPDRYGSPGLETDVYQLGVLVYELVTGQLPFDGTASDIREAKLSEEPPLPSEVADVPDALDDVLVTALGREKTERHDDIVYVRDDLNALFEQYHNEHDSPHVTGTLTTGDDRVQARERASTGEEIDASTEVDEPVSSTESDERPVSWNEYRHQLEDRRENAVLYGVLKKVLYRSLAAEWEHATSRRAEAEDRYEMWATEAARDLLDTLETHLGERGEKLFGDPLSDGVYNMRSTVEETRVKLEDLLRDHGQYLTTGEREIVADRRDNLEWYEHYLQAKRRLDEAVVESEAKLDEIETHIDETLEEDSLLAASDQRSLVQELDGVSETLRRVKRSLDTEVLTDQDIGQFEELLRQERTLRERIERHNPDLAQRRYRTRIEEATAVREQTDDAIATYRCDGTTFPDSIDTYRSLLHEECETLETFLESRHPEWLATDQLERLEDLWEELEANKTVVKSKATFETRLSTLEKELSKFQTTVDETLDGESYLDKSTRGELDEQLDSLWSQLDEIETDEILDPLTDEDSEEFDEYVSSVNQLEATIEAYNPNLVQERYEKHVSMAEKELTATSDALSTCREHGGPLPAPAVTYSEPLDQAIQQLDMFLDRPQAKYLDADQREEVERLRDQLSDHRLFVMEKEAFETKLQHLHDALADFRLLVDDTLDMETYLTAATREELQAQAEGVRDEIQVIVAEEHLETLAETDNNRLEACRAALSSLEERIQSYNDRFVSAERNRLFDVLNPLPVDQPNEQQQLAVIRNERHNRIIAGPGTGKTYSLLCRVRYLVNRGVTPDKILVLAFNNHTQGELKRRLREEFDVTDVQVNTLHSFGQGLVGEAYPDESVLVGQSRRREVGRLVRELNDSDDNFQRHYEEFIDLYREDQVSGDYRTRKQFYDSLDYQSGKTFLGEELEPTDEESRVAHATIADTLFKYDVEYQYRQYANWAAPSDGELYVPDFTLSNHDITIDYLPSPAASREREWYNRRRSATQIRQLNAEAGWQSVIIHGEDISQANIAGVLRDNLKDESALMATPRSERDLVNEAYEENKLWRDVEARLAEFVKKAKTNRVVPSERVDRVDEDENPMRYHFNHMGAAIFDAYQERYATYGVYDYEDMMLRARERAQQGSVDDVLDYRHVLVDEFQDLNRVQIDLLQAILDRSEDIHLFAVGDDWQSIYGFRGARPEFFVEFEDRFSPATTTQLTTNYRCPTAVVDGSSAVMAESDLETDKSLEAAPSNPETTPTIYRLAGNDEWQYETNVTLWAATRVEQSLEDADRSPSEILVLARNEEGSPFVPRIAKELKSRDIAVNDGWESVTVTTAHSAKGGEAEHVILVNAVDDRTDGFPPKEQESSLTQLVESGEQDHIAEERRLFYMALTRAKNQLDIQTRSGHESLFLTPLDEYVTEKCVPVDWKANRISVTGKVKNPTEEVSAHRQLGTLIVDGYHIPYLIPYDALDVELLAAGQYHHLENVAIGEYDGNPQLRIDDATTVEPL